MYSSYFFYMKGSKTVNWSISVETVMHSSQWIFRVFKIQYQTCLLSSVLLKILFVCLLQSEGWPVVLSELFWGGRGGGFTMKPVMKDHLHEKSVFSGRDKRNKVNTTCASVTDACAVLFLLPCPLSLPHPTHQVKQTLPNQYLWTSDISVETSDSRVVFKVVFIIIRVYSTEATAPVSMSFILDTLVCGCLLKGTRGVSCLCCCFFLGTWTSSADCIVLCFYCHVAQFIV